MAAMSNGIPILGYRWIQNDAAILGGYVFASRSQVANRSSGFRIIDNPGVEALGSRWDARINGYRLYFRWRSQ